SIWPNEFVPFFAESFALLPFCPLEQMPVWPFYQQPIGAMAHVHLRIYALEQKSGWSVTQLIPFLSLQRKPSVKNSRRALRTVRGRSLSERYGTEARTDQNRTVDRRWSASPRKSPIPPAICKKFAGFSAKPCKFYRAILDDSRVRSTAWEFFTDDSSRPVLWSDITLYRQSETANSSLSSRLVNESGGEPRRPRSSGW